MYYTKLFLLSVQGFICILLIFLFEFVCIGEYFSFRKKIYLLNSPIHSNSNTKMSNIQIKLYSKFRGSIDGVTFALIPLHFLTLPLYFLIFPFIFMTFPYICFNGQTSRNSEYFEGDEFHEHPA
jgi:hypothetical protein